MAIALWNSGWMWTCRWCSVSGWFYPSRRGAEVAKAEHERFCPEREGANAGRDVDA